MRLFCRLEMILQDDALLCRPLCERRQLLECNVTEVKNRIMLSEQTLIKVTGPWVVGGLCR